MGIYDIIRAIETDVLEILMTAFTIVAAFIALLSSYALFRVLWHLGTYLRNKAESV